MQSNVDDEALHEVVVEVRVRSEIRSGEDLYEDGVLVGEDVGTRLPQSPLQSRRRGGLLILMMVMSKPQVVVVQVQTLATKMILTLATPLCSQLAGRRCFSNLCEPCPGHFL